MSREDRAFDALARRFFNIMVERNPDFATYIGIHKYDHLMPDESRKRYLDDIKIARAMLQNFRALDPTRLSQNRAIDRDLAIHNLRLMLFKLTRLRFWERDPDAAELLGDALWPLFVRTYRPAEKRAVAITARLNQAPRVFEQVRLRVSKPVRLWCQIALESSAGLPAFLSEIRTWARKQLCGRALTRLEAAISTASRANEEHKRALRKMLPRARERFAIGKRNFAQLIRLRELGLDTDEILCLGERYLAEEKARLRQLAREILPGATIAAARRAILARKPKNFAQAQAAYRRAIKRARSFIRQKRIATIPAAEQLIVLPTPSYLRHTHPFAAYFQPAKFDREQLGIYIITPPKTRAQLEKHNYAAILNTSVHEAYPGHHLQLVCANKNPSLIRVLSHASEFVEGWAHYCEELMRELGFVDTPEIRFIQTQDMIWRAARIVIDVKLSCGLMSFHEAVRFLTSQTGMSRESAIAEVKRYTKSPGYQLSYLLGKHMLKRLRDELRQKLRGRFDERKFHDTLLYAGCLPLKYIREIAIRKLAT